MARGILFQKSEVFGDLLPTISHTGSSRSPTVCRTVNRGWVDYKGSVFLGVQETRLEITNVYPLFRALGTLSRRLVSLFTFPYYSIRKFAVISHYLCPRTLRYVPSFRLRRAAERPCGFVFAINLRTLKAL